VNADPKATERLPEHRPPTILVVEDELLLRLEAAERLRECGFRVLEASNAAEGRTLFEAHLTIDIVFTDVQMPGDMNGFEFARWVRQHHPATLMVLTSGGGRMSRDAADLCDYASFVEKPCDYPFVVTHFKELLAKRRN
jgi:CheY-like chemotaxis protein